MKKIFILSAIIPLLAACYGTTYQQQVNYVATDKKIAPVVDDAKNTKTIYLDKKAVAVIPHFTKTELTRISASEFVNRAKNEKTRNMFILDEAKVGFKDIGPDWAFFNLDVDNDTFQVSAFFTESQFNDFNTYKYGDTVRNVCCTYKKSDNANFVSGVNCYMIKYE